MTEQQKSAVKALTFIGFGEAAKAMVAGLRAEQPALAIHLADIRFAGDEGTALRAEAESLGATVHDALGDAVAAGEIVLSTVVAKAAVPVAEAAAAMPTMDPFRDCPAIDPSGGASPKGRTRPSAVAVQ